MRVVHAVRSDGFAGVERHVARLARAQAARGHRVLVVGGEPAAMRATSGPDVVHVPARTTLDVVRVLRAAGTGADVVHVHMTAAEVAATLAGATVPGFPPVVSTRHFAAPRGSGRLGAVTATVARRRVDAQIAVSDFVATHVDGPSVVVHPGVDPHADGRPAEERDRVVLMVQRLEAEKRTDLGLRAFASSGLAADGWRVLVAGDGSQRGSLESLAADLGILPHTEFLGVRHDVEELMDRAAVLLAPCPAEGLGLSVLEAMAVGLPVVAAGVGGHTELLAGLDPSALYPPTDWRRAGAQVAELARDPQRRRRYGQAAKAAQRERFTPGAQVRATDEVYLQVTGHEPEGRRPEELVVVSLEAWDEVWRRNQYLVTELARANPALRVLFVEPAADPLHQLSRRARPRPGRGLRRAHPLPGVEPDRLWLYQPTKVLPRRVDPAADERLAAQVRRAAARAGLEAPVLWVNDPAAARLVTTTAWPALYDITDDWLAAPRTPAEHARLVRDEALLLERCREVVVCSPHLVRTKGAQRPVELITNAVDLARYRSPHARPADLPPGPVAMYVGTVHPDRFDVDVLLATTARVADRAAVVLVGPVVDLTDAQHRALDAAGVLTLGPRPWTAVPAYLQHASVLLVPHQVNDFTDSLDPIKLYEYRAVGVPVVATPVAGFREGGRPLVEAVPATGFPDAVLRVLSDPPPRQEPAEDIPTWHAQAARMARVIDRTRGARPH